MICQTKRWTRLPSLPIVIEILKAFIQRSDDEIQLGEGNSDAQRYVTEGRSVATEKPFASVGEMSIDHCRMSERLFSAMFAPRCIVRQLEFVAEAVPFDVKHGDERIEHANHNAIVPHCILHLLKRRCAENVTAFERDIEETSDRNAFR